MTHSEVTTIKSVKESYTRVYTHACLSTCLPGEPWETGLGVWGLACEQWSLLSEHQAQQLHSGCRWSAGGFFGNGLLLYASWRTRRHSLQYIHSGWVWDKYTTVWGGFPFIFSPINHIMFESHKPHPLILQLNNNCEKWHYILAIHMRLNINLTIRVLSRLDAHIGFAFV